MIDSITILDMLLKPTLSLSTVFAIATWSFVGGMIVMKLKAKHEGIIQ